MTKKPAHITNTYTYPPQSARLYLDLSVFWFAISFLWAGMITIVMQSLVRQMAGDAQKDLYLGWTLAIGALVSTVIVIIVGAVSDRSRWKMGKRRPYIIIGTVLSIPVLLWLPYVGSIALLIVNFCLLQLWVNYATSPYQALIPDLVPKGRQGIASAYMGMSSLVGQLGGLLLCWWIFSRPNGLLYVSLTFSAVLIVTMLYTALRVKERSAEDNPATRLGVAGTVVESFRVNPREHPDFFRLIASRFVINLGFYSATEFLFYYVLDTLRAPNADKATAMILVTVSIAGLIGNFPAGILSDRMSKKRVVYGSTAISCVAALIFVVSGSVTTAMVAAAIFGAGFGAFMAVDWAFATNLLPERDEAKYMGIWHVAFTVPQVIAPVIGGAVAYFFNTTLIRMAHEHTASGWASFVNAHMTQGFGYRAVLFLVVIYMILGTTIIRPIRERVIPDL